MMRRRIPSLALFILLTAFAAHAADPAVLHEAFTRVLARHVADGRVDYAGLKAAPGPLNAYLDDLAAVKEPEFTTWARADRLAFLLNLYNAATLRLVVDHFPVSGIRKIGGVLKGPWKLEVVRLHGRVISLDELEHSVIRPGYPEPRIHFALVCAARSCPPLRSEAYAGPRLEAQLDDQARTFLSTPAKNRVDAARKILWLSPIFEWYREDFTAGGRTLEQAVAPYFPKAAASALAEGGYRVKFTTYDWALNGK